MPDLALQQDADLLTLVNQGLSWQIKCVAGRADPLYAGKGLAGQCIAALQQEVQRANGGKEFAEWIDLSEEQNGAYWRRRGFVAVGESELMPRGDVGQ